jgi:hypothetical protein
VLAGIQKGIERGRQGGKTVNAREAQECVRAVFPRVQVNCLRGNWWIHDEPEPFGQLLAKAQSQSEAWKKAWRKTLEIKQVKVVV